MRNIVINKGNYSFEPSDREAAFEARRGKGWEAAYAAYRQAWTTRPTVSDFGAWPLLVDLELSSACNLRCPMCYTITKDFKQRVKISFMPFELFCRIIDEIAPHVPALRLSLRGEPSLHPRFLDCVRYAKEHGVCEVSFLTNAGMLTDSLTRDLVEAGADWITVSVDGLAATYENIRRPLKFEDTVQKLIRLRDIRNDMGTPRPVIKVQSIWPAIKDNFAEYYSFFSRIADSVAFNPLIDYLENDDYDLVKYEDGFRCPMLYQRLVIASDGEVLPCANDEKSRLSLGNIENTTIFKMWNGARLTAFRDAHAKLDGFRKFPTCAHCYLPRLTQGEVHAFPDGREFIVKNYVNRSQQVGK